MNLLNYFKRETKSEKQIFDQLKESFYVPGEKGGKRLLYAGDLLRFAAKTYGERTALIGEHRTLSYKQLYAQSCALSKKLQQQGIDPRSAVGEIAGGFSEFSIGFSEEVVGQATSLVNLGNLLESDIKRKGRIDLEVIGRSDIGFDVGEPELVAPRRELRVPRTITSEFIGGGIEGLITGQDAGALASQRVDEFLIEREGQEIRTSGQLGGFLLPFAVGGAGIIATTLKTPRAFLPVITTKTVKATPLLRRQQLQITSKINRIRGRAETLADRNVALVNKLKDPAKIARAEEKFRIKNNKLTAQVRSLLKTLPKNVGADDIAIPIVETQQVARGLTFFGRTIATKVSGQGRFGGIRRGAPSEADLLPQIRSIGSTPRTARYRGR